MGFGRLSSGWVAWESLALKRLTIHWWTTTYVDIDKLKITAIGVAKNGALIFKNQLFPIMPHRPFQVLMCWRLDPFEILVSELLLKVGRKPITSSIAGGCDSLSGHLVQTSCGRVQSFERFQAFCTERSPCTWIVEPQSQHLLLLLHIVCLMSLQFYWSSDESIWPGLSLQLHWTSDKHHHIESVVMTAVCWRRESVSIACYSMTASYSSRRMQC